MKKLLALMLCCLMVFSMVACGNSGSSDNNDKPNQDNNVIEGTTDIVKLSDKHVNETQKISLQLNEGEVITPNGELPNNEEDVSSLDQRYYFNEAINAVIQLDEEQMKLYLSEEECADILRVKEDAKAYALWQHTVGNMSYLPSADAWYGRSINLMYAMWYQDQMKANATLPENVVFVSYNDLAKIYNEYYDKVPIVTAYCGGPDEFYIDDGYIKFKIGSPLLMMGISEFADIMNEDTWYNENDEVTYTNRLYELVLGWSSMDDNWGNYDDIREDGEFVLLDALLSLDVDTVETIIDSSEDVWVNEWDSEEYDKYLKTPEAKEALKEFMKNNVQVYRTYEDIYMLFKVDNTSEIGDYQSSVLSDASDAEQELINNVVYYHVEEAMFHENLGKQFRYTFGEVIQEAIHAKVFRNIPFKDE